MLNWQQKAAALDALSEIEIHIRAPGDWYIHQDVGIGGDGTVKSQYGNGCTPQDAIEDHWNILTNISTDEYLVVGNGEMAKRVRWNGFMWDHVSDSVAKNIRNRIT